MVEYKFERVELNWRTKKPERDYHKLIEAYGKEGWQLVQIFTPPTGIGGFDVFYEIILMRDPSQEEAKNKNYWNEK